MPRGVSINAPSKFMGSNGTVFVAKMFYEGDSREVNPDALYTIAREDKTIGKRVYRSLYLLYMSEEDITEARFVDIYLHDWYQWNKIASSSLYRDEITKWRTDLKARLLGRLVDTLVNDAFSESRSAKSSAKYLVDKLSKGPKGKPTTAVVPATEDTVRSITTEVARDLKRLNLVN